MSDTWTIGELAEHAARALRDGAPPPANGRVRDVPGERLIRWYTTIGLVDPPLTRRGRIARYGRRHLLQLVAVKRLQAMRPLDRRNPDGPGGSHGPHAGVSGKPGPPTRPQDRHLPRRLFPCGPPPDSATLGNAPSGNTSLDVASRDAASRNGASHGNASSGNAAQDSVSLEAASLDGASLENGSVDAGYPDGASLDNASSDAGSLHGVSREGGTVEGALLGDGGRAGRGRFWVERPDAAGVTARERAAGTPSPAKAARREGDGRRVVTGVRLGGGARLVLDAGRVPSEEDVQAVLAAAGPLLAVLEERNLI